jgi:hypothetical protein
LPTPAAPTWAPHPPPELDHTSGSIAAAAGPKTVDSLSYAERDRQSALLAGERDQCALVGKIREEGHTKRINFGRELQAAA